MFARAHTGAVGAAGVRGTVGVPAALAHVSLWYMAFTDLGAGQVDPRVALVTFNHGSACKRLHAETRHQIPRVII